MVNNQGAIISFLDKLPTNAINHEYTFSGSLIEDKKKDILSLSPYLEDFVVTALAILLQTEDIYKFTRGEIEAACLASLHLVDVSRGLTISPLKDGETYFDVCGVVYPPLEDGKEVLEGYMKSSILGFLDRGNIKDIFIRLFTGS